MADYNAQNEGLTTLDQVLLAANAATARMNGRDGFLEAIQAADSMVQAKVKKVTDEHTAGFLQAVMGQGMDPAVAYQKYPRASEKLIVGFLDRIMSQRETLDAEGRAQNRAIEAEERQFGRQKGMVDYNRASAQSTADANTQRENDQARLDAQVAPVLANEAAATPPPGQGVRLDPAAGGLVPVSPATSSVIPRKGQGFLDQAGVTPSQLRAGAEMREVEPGFFAAAERVGEKADAKRKLEAEIAAKTRGTVPTNPDSRVMKYLVDKGMDPVTAYEALSELKSTAAGQRKLEEILAIASPEGLTATGNLAAARTEGGLLGGATPEALDARQAGAAAAAAGTVAGSGGKVTPIPDMVDPATGLPIFANNQGQMSTGTPPAGVMPEKRASEADVTFEQATGLIRDNISQIKKLYSSDFTGKWDSKIVANLRQRTTGNSEQEAAFRIAVASMQDTELRKRSGAAITDSEMARLQQFVPDPNMSDTEFAAAMNNYERELDAIIAARQAAKKPWKAKSAAPAAATGGLPAGAFQGADGGWYVKNPDGKTAKRVK